MGSLGMSILSSAVDAVSTRRNRSLVHDLRNALGEAGESQSLIREQAGQRTELPEDWQVARMLRETDIDHQTERFAPSIPATRQSVMAGVMARAESESQQKAVRRSMDLLKNRERNSSMDDAPQEYAGKYVVKLDLDQVAERTHRRPRRMSVGSLAFKRIEMADAEADAISTQQMDAQYNAERDPAWNKDATVWLSSDYLKRVAEPEAQTARERQNVHTMSLQRKQRRHSMACYSASAGSNIDASFLVLQAQMRSTAARSHAPRQPRERGADASTFLTQPKAEQQANDDPSSESADGLTGEEGLSLNQGPDLEALIQVGTKAPPTEEHGQPSRPASAIGRFTKKLRNLTLKHGKSGDAGDVNDKDAFQVHASSASVPVMSRTSVPLGYSAANAPAPHLPERSFAPTPSSPFTRKSLEEVRSVPPGHVPTPPSPFPRKSVEFICSNGASSPVSRASTVTHWELPPCAADSATEHSITSRSSCCSTPKGSFTLQQATSLSGPIDPTALQSKTPFRRTERRLSSSGTRQLEAAFLMGLDRRCSTELCSSALVPTVCQPTNFTARPTQESDPRIEVGQDFGSGGDPSARIMRRRRSSSGGQQSIPSVNSPSGATGTMGII